MVGSKKLPVVRVMVISGLVAYSFGEMTGILKSGMSQVFGEEPQAVRELPEGIRGFIGMLRGKVLKKGEEAFILQVTGIEKTWRNSKARNPKSVIGKNVRFVVSRKPIREEYARIDAGDEVVVGGRLRHGVFETIEVLVKAEEFPVLKAKWEENARKRRERAAHRRAEREWIMKERRERERKEREE